MAFSTFKDRYQTKHDYSFIDILTLLSLDPKEWDILDRRGNRDIDFRGIGLVRVEEFKFHES